MSSENENLSRRITEIGTRNRLGVQKVEKLTFVMRYLNDIEYDHSFKLVFLSLSEGILNMFSNFFVLFKINLKHKMANPALELV